MTGQRGSIFGNAVCAVITLRVHTRFHLLRDEGLEQVTWALSCPRNLPSFLDEVGVSQISTCRMAACSPGSTG
jgi:hypothetical protein